MLNKTSSVCFITIGLLLPLSVMAGASDTNKKIGSTLHKKVEVALSEIPEQAMSAIKAITPNFVANEVEKEFKHGNVYLDVEGMVDGSEIEFDMLQTETGWKVVEVQTDLSFAQLPVMVSNHLREMRPNLSPKRIIESIQHGTDVIIYELYSVDASGKESRTEVKVQQGDVIILGKEWQH